MKDIVLFLVIIFCFSSELLIAICTELPVEKVNGRTFIYVAKDIIKHLPEMYIISLPPFYNPLILLKSIQKGMTLGVFFHYYRFSSLLTDQILSAKNSTGNRIKQ